MKFLKEKKALYLAILSLSLPAIIEMSLNTMLGVSDTIMLGRLINSDAIASVGFSNQIIFTLIFTFSAFNTGAVAMISRAYGEKNYSKLKRISEQNVILNLIIGTLIFILSIATSKIIFNIYDVEPHILKNSILYFRIVLFGLIPMFLSFSFAAILRGSGNTKTPMYVTGFVNVFNIVFNFLLITGFGPFPKLGIAGAAWATTFSRIISMIIYIYLLYVKDSSIKLKFELFFDQKIIKPLYSVSWPGAIEQGLMQLSFVVIGVIVSQLTTKSESLFRILIQIESLSFMPAVGISIAAATLVGKAIGEKDIDKATETGHASSILGVLWGICIGITFLFFPREFLQFFTIEEAILTIGVPVMPFLAFNQPGLNFMIIMGGALRGTGDTKKLMVLTISRLWLLFVPLSYVFIILLGKGVSGLWYGEIISIIVFAALIYNRFRSRKWANIKL